MKRFWSEAVVEAVDGGYAVRLDARPLMTPARSSLVLPTLPLARAVAREWDAQGERVQPQELPLTRAANSTIDGVIPRRAEVAAAIATYGETDLLCYRAPHPAGLTRLQSKEWDPWLDWAEQEFDARLRTGTGVMHVLQPEAEVTALARAVNDEGPWALTALHELVTLSGSLVLGLAVRHRALDPGEAWRLSRIEEDWQIAEWGEDAEAAAVARRREAEFRQAAQLLDLLGETRD